MKPGEMKLKQLGRLGGVVRAGGFGFMTYLLGNLISSVDYSKFGEFMAGDYPLSYKICSAAWLTTVHMLAPFAVMGIADGLYDIRRGTHHYLGCRIWQKLTRNEETKKKIEGELEHMLKRIEESINP